MAKSRFKVVAKMLRSMPTEGTVVIDRQTGVVQVRPHRSRRTYDTNLDTIAQMVVQSTIIAEVRAKRLAKKAARKNT